ncbi:MAG: DMT family transporter [Anaerolineales bacterium]|nr:DMT family transporter [Anaerolineales bacterium]
MSAGPLRKGILFGLLAAAIWGGMYVVSKWVLAYVPPFTLLALRLLLGIASLLVWMRWRGSWPRLARRQWLHLLALGVLGYGISLGFQFSGTQLSTAANGAVITAATPALVFLFARGLLGEAIRPRQWGALLLSTLGVLLIINPWQAGLEAQLWRGNLLLVGAALTWALYSVLVRWLSAHSPQPLDPLVLTLVAFIGGLLVVLPAASLELQRQPMAAMNAGLLAGIVYLGVVSTALAAYLWNRAFAILPAGIAGLTFFAQPLVGAGLGIGLLGEPFSLHFAAGGALILACLWLAAQGDRIA